MKKSQAPIVIGAVILIVVAGFFLKVSSSPGCEGQGPCMLYFYADD